MIYEEKNAYEHNDCFMVIYDLCIIELAIQQFMSTINCISHYVSWYLSFMTSDSVLNSPLVRNYCVLFSTVVDAVLHQLVYHSQRWILNKLSEQFKHIYPCSEASLLKQLPCKLFVSRGKCLS